MELVLEGIVFGLGLAILMGPIFIALLQTSIDKGSAAGYTVASGVWVSDIIFIIVSYLFVHKIDGIIRSDDFAFWMSMIGGTILMAFGITVFFAKINPLDNASSSYSAKNFFGFWLKGFLVNTVNPFTFVFWLGVISANVLGRELSQYEASLFLGAILATIIVTDSLKVMMAKYIKSRLTNQLIQRISQIAGAVLTVIGFVWIVRMLSF